jgi:hypothetical protein
MHCLGQFYRDKANVMTSNGGGGGGGGLEETLAL